MPANREETTQPLEDSRFVRHYLYDGDEPVFRRYSRLVLANPSLLRLLRYELLGLLGPLPGAIGLALRKLSYGRLFAQSQGGAIFGRNITLRHPDNIFLGRSVVMDDYSLIDARGAGDDGVRLGDRVLVGRGACIQAKVGGITIGAGTTVGADSQIISQGPIRIAENVSIAGGTFIAGGRYDVTIAHDAPNEKRRFTLGAIVIEPNVRIGMRSIVLDGVTIGRDAIVAPGSVVFDDVAASTVVMGCPARPIRERPIGTRVHDSANSTADNLDVSDAKIRDSIREYLQETYFVDFGEGGLTDDDSLLDSQMLDSVSLVGVITMLEQRFDCSFDERDLSEASLATVSGLSRLVSSKRLARS